MTRRHSDHSTMASANKTPNKDDRPGSGSSSKSSGSVSASGSLTPGRKQLPAVPDSATQVTLANKVAEKKGVTSPSRNHSFGPFLVEYSLMAEYNQIQKQKLPGVYVIPSGKSTLFWHGVLFVRQGLYQGGVFKFSLYMPENYPDGCPRLIFEKPVFHPIIDPESGELDVKRGFQNWRRNVNHIWQVLLYARRIFYKFDLKSPLNPEAAALYEQDHELFKSRVTKFIQECQEQMYDAPISDDPHAIRFTKWEPEMHEEAQKEMLQEKEESPDEGGLKNAQTSGLSWVKGVQIFSRDDSASA